MLKIVISKGCDGRYTYCPEAAMSILRPQYLPGEFNTVEDARAAVKADKSVPAGSRVVVQ